MGLKIQFKISKNPFYYEFIEILSKEIIIGEIGKIKSNIYEGINIEQDVFIASINISCLFLVVIRPGILIIFFSSFMFHSFKSFFSSTSILVVGSK